MTKSSDCFWAYCTRLAMTVATGEGLRAMAKPSSWRDFYDSDIAPQRQSSPFGDTHQPLATLIAIWRHISRFGDRRHKGETAVRTYLITFCIQLVPVGLRMLSKRWQAGEIKKAKVEVLPPYRHPRWLKGLAFSHRWQQKSSGYPNRRGCRATAMLSLLFCRALVILVALPRYVSPSRNSSRATARHLVVQCELSRPISPFHDRRGTAILAATAIANLVQ